MQENLSRQAKKQKAKEKEIKRLGKLLNKMLSGWSIVLLGQYLNNDPPPKKTFAESLGLIDEKIVKAKEKRAQKLKDYFNQK